MPRKSYDELQARLQELQLENGALSTDENWNITTFKALPFRLKREAESARWTVLLHIHNYGAAFPGSIRRAVNFRAPQVLVRARWDNDSDVVFVLSSDPGGFAEKLKVICKNEGLIADVTFIPYSGNIEFDHSRCTEIIPARLAE